MTEATVTEVALCDCSNTELERGGSCDRPECPGRVCGTCGANPCYHICPESPAYYSPERERQDEAHYGEDDHRERYAATAAPDQYEEE